MQRHIIYTFEKILFSNFNNSINYHICKIQNSGSQFPLRWKCFRTVWNKVFSELCILIILFFVFKYWKLWISENIFVKTITFISLHIYRTIFLFENTKKPLFWATLFLWKKYSPQFSKSWYTLCHLPKGGNEEGSVVHVESDGVEERGEEHAEESLPEEHERSFWKVFVSGILQLHRKFL